MTAVDSTRRFQVVSVISESVAFAVGVKLCKPAPLDTLKLKSKLIFTERTAGR